MGVQAQRCTATLTSLHIEEETDGLQTKQPTLMHDLHYIVKRTSELGSIAGETQCATKFIDADLVPKTRPALLNFHLIR